ncbi:LANO_0C03466g1_1 [Lachancea nothofagi CBS 11611]|uniref:LANO_0C03466g1_1 n=1 Tax=Lachancea nothofagi CBS 11611 TaxID=1266666 RepID=A0A1G4J5P0_9SACH|nr:LANO_0C03466g1_1 [Lachancea nothofagi CBS 11611]
MSESSDHKRSLEELQESNQVLALAVQRTRLAVKRLRLEYGTLLERLESRIDKDPELCYEDPLPSLESFRTQILEDTPKSKSKRKKGKERDPNLPKRPTNAYLLFCEMNKESMKQSAGPNDVSKALTDAWKGLDENGRRPYYDLYSEDRDRYQREMQAYARSKNANTKPSKKNDDDEEEEADEDDDTDGTQPDVDATTDIPTSEA